MTRAHIINAAWLLALLTAAWVGSIAWLLAIVGIIVFDGVLELKALRTQQGGTSSSKAKTHAAVGGGCTGGLSMTGLWNQPPVREREH
jgi:hypothetical protein